jgi:hypothetical protein
METSMYYTFSTIAQVLGALVALGGVFIIFRLQDLKTAAINIVQDFINQVNGVFEGIDGDKTRYYNNVHYCYDILVKVVILHRAHILKGMLNEMNIVIKNHPDIEDRISSLKAIRDLLEKNLSLKSSLILNASLSMIFGILTILFSIVILHWVPYIMQAGCIKLFFNNLLFCMGLSGFLVCVTFMGITVYLALKE